jgi:hypothetical protein
VAKNSPDLWAQVDKDHVFKQKEHHTKTLNKKGLAMLTDIGIDYTQYPIAELIVFIMMSVHDLGRAIDAMKDRNKLPAGFNANDDHGVYTLVLLKLWGVFDCFKDDAKILISFVIKYHTTKQTPVNKTAGELDLESLCFATLALVRDLDKLALFEEKTRPYIFSSTERAGQAEVIRRKFNPNFTPDDECVSEQVLNAYLQRMADGGTTVIERAWMTNNCEYMLQFLSWITDVNFDAILKQIITTGAIHILLGYIVETQEQWLRTEIINRTNDYLISRLGIEITGNDARWAFKQAQVEFKQVTTVTNIDPLQTVEKIDKSGDDMTTCPECGAEHAITECCPA